MSRAADILPLPETWAVHGSLTEQAELRLAVLTLANDKDMTNSRRFVCIASSEIVRLFLVSILESQDPARDSRNCLC